VRIRNKIRISNFKFHSWNARFLLFLIFCFLLKISPAQLFIPISDDPFGVTIRFNADSIRKNKIEGITASLQYKPDERKIEDKGLKEYYHFDSLGRLDEYWRTRVQSYSQVPEEHPAVYRKGRKIRPAWTEYKYAYSYDTVFVNYYYDNYGRLACRRQADGEFYSTWYYIYNTDGTLARRTHCRETNLGKDHRNFRLGVQTVISQEDFSYQRFSNRQVKQLCLNDEGKPYKETMMMFDDKGRPLDFREAYMSGGVRIITTWIYDSNDRTAGWIYSSNAGGEYLEETRYLYDSLGRIESVKRYENDKLKDEFSYLYNGNEPIAYAYINRRHIEMGIDIVKLAITQRV
jgi:hypothetical protein